LVLRVMPEPMLSDSAGVVLIGLNFLSSSKNRTDMAALV
jgi:hypothetical protein